MILPISVPNPMVVISSDPVSPVRPVGSDVTLICTVELSPAVDVPVTVNTLWTGPDGVTLVPVMESLTSTAIVSSFGRDQSGVYTCMATVRSTSVFITDSSSQFASCLLYTSPSPRDATLSRMPSSA